MERIPPLVAEAAAEAAEEEDILPTACTAEAAAEAELGMVLQAEEAQALFKRRLTTVDDTATMALQAALLPAVLVVAVILILEVMEVLEVLEEALVVVAQAALMAHHPQAGN